MVARSPRYAFGPFVLIPDERMLVCRDEAVEVAPRAFDVLAHLVAQPGHLVTREELFEVAWPGLVVEENALTVAMSRLRGSLGSDGRNLIETVPGRGYRFIGEVCELDGQEQRIDGTVTRPETPSSGAPGRQPAEPFFSGGTPAIIVAVLLVSMAALVTWRPPGSEQGSAWRAPPPAALQAYQRGRALLDARSFDHARMLAEFKRATDLDPSFAPGYVAQAQLYAMQHRAGDEADAALARAFALDSNLAEAWATRGFVQAFQRWDWTAAERSFDRALSLDPSNPTARQWLASMRMAQRRFDEAENLLRGALLANPTRAGLYADLCEVRYYRLDLDAAAAACDRASALDPSHAMARRNRGYLALFGPRGVTAARDQMARQPRYIGDAFNRARLFARLGERDSTLALANEIVELRGFLAPYLNADPVFDFVRSDERWRAIMGEMRLQGHAGLP